MDSFMDQLQYQPVRQLDILTYLHSNNWIYVEEPKNKFIIFQNPEEKSIELYFPKDPSEYEERIYSANAIDIISQIEKLDSSFVIQNILNYDRDILRVRITNASPEAIPLKLAAQQVNELKYLIAYGARSEIDQKPFYIDIKHNDARKIIERYRFGHTFQGSFGLTIESPRVVNVENYRQLSFLPELVDKQISNLSLDHRVMIRIAKGINSVHKSVTDQNLYHIIDNYQTGLNANMCLALANMMGDKEINLEFSIKWSNLMIPSDPELSSFKPVLFSDMAFENLKYSAKKLTEIKPIIVTVTGLVTDLHAKASPLELDTSRTVNIQWVDPIESKTYNATATLSAEDYLVADHAHMTWQPVTIVGNLHQSGRNWKFIDYQAFSIGPAFPET